MTNGDITKMIPIPDYIRTLPQPLIDGWMEVYKRVIKDEGVYMAVIIANNWIQNNSIKYYSNKITLTFQTEGPRLVMKSIGGDNYVDFVLTDDGYDRQGQKISPNLMKKWVDQINTGGLKIKGDFDHEMYDELLAKGLSADKVLESLKTLKNGVAESVKAIYDKGKMWLRALINPDYEDSIYESYGVSLEAELVIDDTTNTAVDGRLGGFTFARKAPQVNPRSVISK